MKRSAHASGVAIVALLVALWLGGLDLSRYAAYYPWWPDDLSAWDRLVTRLALAASTLWLLLPALFVSMLLIWRARFRAAWLLVGTATAFVAAWNSVDYRVWSVTGNRLVEYLRFVDEASPMVWAGGAETVRALSGTAVSAMLLAIGVTAIVAWAVRLLPSAGSTLRVRFLSIAVLLSLLAVAVSPRLGTTMGAPTVLHRVSKDLGVPLPLLALPAADVHRVEYDFYGEISRIYAERRTELLSIKTVDDSVDLGLGRLPNVALFIVEGLRPDAIDARWMPRLSTLAERGLHLQHHYAGSNTSHRGGFALLTGRSPLLYDRTLAEDVPTQLTYTLRKRGYASACFTSGELEWQGMGLYLSTRNFDDVVSFYPQYGHDWIRGDSDAVARLVALLRDRTPAIAVAWLNSTHFPFHYPPSAARFGPVPSASLFQYRDMAHSGGREDAYRQQWLNRYRNSLVWLDELLSRALDSLDLDNTVVIVAGDHGESFFEDGTWLHSSRLSDAQTRAAFVMAGAGVPARAVTQMTSHMDLVPTLFHAISGKTVEVEHAYGRDLLDPAWTPHAVPIVAVGGQQLLLLHPDEERRFHIGVAEQRDKVWTWGFYDETGQALPFIAAREDDRTRWMELAAAMFDRTGR